MIVAVTNVSVIASMAVRMMPSPFVFAGVAPVHKEFLELARDGQACPAKARMRGYGIVV
jgi:hypothetical protein